jgi:hypothetical protein
MSISKGYALLRTDNGCSVNRIESENQMLDLDEFLTHLEVQTNILNEKRAEQERYERGVKAMREASNIEQV